MKSVRLIALTFALAVLPTASSGQTAQITALTAELLSHIGDWSGDKTKGGIEGIFDKAIQNLEKFDADIAEQIAPGMPEFSLGRPTSKVARDYDVFLAAYEEFIVEKYEKPRQAMVPVIQRLERTNEYADRADKMARSLFKLWMAVPGGAVTQAPIYQDLYELKIPELQNISNTALHRARGYHKALDSWAVTERRKLDGYKNWLTKPACGNALKPAPCKQKVPVDAPGGRFDGGGVGGRGGRGGVVQ